MKYSDGKTAAMVGDVVRGKIGGFEYPVQGVVVRLDADGRIDVVHTVKNDPSGYATVVTVAESKNFELVLGVPRPAPPKKAATKKTEKEAPAPKQ